MKEQNEIGDVFRNAFDGFEIQPSNNVWNGIKESTNINTPKKSGFSKFSNLFKIAGSIAIVTVIVFVAVKLFESNKTEISVKDETTAQNINNPQIVDNLQNNTINDANNETVETVEEIEKSNSQIIQPKKEVNQVVENNSNVENNVEIVVDKGVKQDEKNINKKLTDNNPPKENTPIEITNSKSNNSSSNENKESFKEVENNSTTEIPDPKYISNEKFICFGEDAIISASYGKTYIWDNGSTLKTIKVEPVNTTIYTVTCTDEKSNVWIENITINIDKSCSSVFAPNAFTPDGDGYNDVFLVKGIGIKEFSMSIYSRRSELVFETNDINQGWDGKYRGNDALSEVYFYRINYTDGLGNPHRKVGNITLIK
ncbi:MAG: gliding motility-associated C-terminal domain-containing protein [Saprospiraceae bacterium]|nr:gliding motility-associated C-terminal domain-containing protein [Saprospiraceae bacterium]